MANLLRRRVWLPSSPLHALAAKLPSIKVTYVSGDDLASAASAAKSADVAIVFGYQPESEGMDLKTLDLGEDQDKLIETVAAANARTIVVLETGSPATMPWIDKVAGVVEAWYPGIRGAEALANLLTGEVNPGGKLAITFPKSDEDLPHPTLVLPPPASQPQRPAPGADIYDETTDAWKLAPGSYTIMAGGSSQTLSLHQQISLQ
jgi:beta-glucosidase